MGYHEQMPLIKLFDPSSMKSHGKKLLHIPNYIRPMPTKLGKDVTYCEGLLPVNSYNPLILSSQKVIQQFKKLTATTTMAMARGIIIKVVICHNECPLINFHESSMRWLFEVRAIFIHFQAIFSKSLLTVHIDLRVLLS